MQTQIANNKSSWCHLERQRLETMWRDYADEVIILFLGLQCCSLVSGGFATGENRNKLTVNWRIETFYSVTRRELEKNRSGSREKNAIASASASIMHCQIIYEHQLKHHGGARRLA